MEIKYFSRESQDLQIEKVYGDAAVRWMYETSSGKTFSELFVRPFVSKAYGALQSSSLISKRKIKPFIRDFAIKMDEFDPTPGRTEEDPYAHFNEFFIRPFKAGKRPFVSDEHLFPAPCEARYFGHAGHSDDLKIPVKGVHMRPRDLVFSEKWAETFSDGPLVVARLCPVDYHRYHYPDAGEVVESYRVPGILHSVNPIALKQKSEIFLQNERQVSILETKNFGKLAYIEVGATCVGKIVQSSKSKQFSRGEEKGYFLFGGSTVILLGEKGAWTPSQDILDWTAKGTEVYLKLGQEMGHKL